MYEEEKKDEELNEEESDLEGILLTGGSQGKNDEKDSDLQDSDYTFSHNSDNNVEDNCEVPRALVTLNGEPPRLGDENEVDLEYADYEELNSCSLIDEDEMGPIRPRYSKFNEEFEMKNP